MLINANNLVAAPEPSLKKTGTNRNELIVQPLNKIHALLDTEATINDGFLSGTLGVICYYYHAARILQLPHLKDNADQLLQNIFESINEQNARLAGCTFGNGLAGFAAVVSHLQQAGLIDVDVPSEFAELDELFFATALQWIEINHTDYLHGAFGIVHYFSLREPTNTILAYLQKLIEAICKNTIVEDNQHAWLRNCSLREANPQVANLGLAHGLCGMLMILMNACTHLPAATILSVKQLVEKATAFILQNQHLSNKANNRYSQFPFFVHPGEANEEDTPNRLAWCYGDLNEVLLLYRASQFLSKEELNSAATRIGLQASLRVDELTTKATNAHFCHGASGLAQMYKVLYSETGLPTYLHLYDIWINRTLDYLEKDMEQKTFAGKETDLLEGLVGPAFVLLSYLNNEASAWSKLLLL